MRKLALLSLVLILSTGCRGGLLSRIFRGAPCGKSCGLSLPAAPAQENCSSCANGTSAGYGSYEGEVYDSGIVDGGYVDGGIVDGGVMGSGYYDGGIVTGSYPADGTIINGPIVSGPTMEPITPAGSGTVGN